MLTEKNKQFIIHWEQVREKESTFQHKFLSGLPMAFMFGLPILIFFGVVKIFFPTWFNIASQKPTDVITPELTPKMMSISAGDVAMAFIAVIIVVLFFSYFRMNYKWEMNEQLYKELKSALKKEEQAALKV